MAAKKAKAPAPRKKPAIKQKYTKSAILAEIAENTDLSRKRLQLFLMSSLYSSSVTSRKVVPVSSHCLVCSRSRLSKNLLARHARVFQTHFVPAS